MEKNSQREKLLNRVAQKCICTVAYVNAVGGNDELIFEQNSMVVDKKKYFEKESPQEKDYIVGQIKY
jgi:NAD+ synthase (glutamine-hydrolysing)